MDSLERVKRTIEFGRPDRYPIMHAVLPAAWMRYGEKLYSILRKYPTYLHREAVEKTGGTGKWRPAAAGYEMSEELMERFVLEDDFVFVEPRTFQYGKPGRSGYQSDEWGCIWRKEDPGLVGQVVVHPLAKIVEEGLDDKALEAYNFPDGSAYWRYDYPFLKAQEQFAYESRKYFLAYIGNLFELMQWLVGFENLMIAFHERPTFVFKLIDKIVEYSLETLREFAKYNIQGVSMNDDWGTQRSLMIDPNMWRKYFKPAYKTIFQEAKERGLHVHFHTDGNTIEIIEDLIEIGVDVINPQLSAIDLERLSKIVKGRVCIRTDIDRQYILPQASRTEVREYVKHVIELLGTKDGGLILCGEINQDAKLENVEEMYRSFEEYGYLREE
ncbi:MAG: hypothetical protein H5U36_06670 [Candidatus Caldatribacterium sp.]|nr:hypothetical protein [Candidatus Caldatribacterium sp.]